MKRQQSAGIILGGWLVLGMAATAAAEGKGEKIFQGTWIVTGAEAEGQKAPAEALKQMQTTMTFTGNRYKVKSKGDTVEEGSYQADSSKDPRTIDIKILAGQDKGKTQLGIYKVDGDTATFSMARPGSKERPTGFTTKPGSGFEVTTLTRQKK